MDLKHPFLPPGYSIKAGFDAKGKLTNTGDIDIVKDGWEVGENYPESLVAWIPNPHGGDVVLKHRIASTGLFSQTVCESKQEALDLIALRLCLGIDGEEPK